MGYYSTMTCGIFKVEDYNEAKKIFEQYRNEDAGGYFYYFLEKVINIEDSQQKVMVVPEGEEYTAKHYEDKRLAEAISKIIAPGETTELTFDGEDGEKWGYKISHGKVEELSFVPMTDEELSIFKQVKDLDANSLAFVLKLVDALHPTLQQRFMQCILYVIKEMSQWPEFDKRNQASIKIAKKLIKVIDEQDMCLPFI